jgi:hypothetical protein
MKVKVFLSRAIVVALVISFVTSVLVTLGGVNLYEPGGESVVPDTVVYKGLLTDQPTGDPVADGNYTLVFSLYDVETGGSPLWQETQEMAVEDGLFRVALGSNESLNASLFDGSVLYVGVKVEGDTEMTPRQYLFPALQAFHAEETEYAHHYNTV